MIDWCGWPLVDDSTNFEAAQQILIDAELSDGLPLVPPTRRRLDAMLARVKDRSESHGLMPPMLGDITAEAVARAEAVGAGVNVELAREPDAIHVIVTGGAGYKMTYLPVWGGGSQTVTRPV